MNLDELSFLESSEERAQEEDLETTLEREKEKVEKILQNLQPQRLREN